MFVRLAPGSGDLEGSNRNKAEGVGREAASSHCNQPQPPSAALGHVVGKGQAPNKQQACCRAS